MILVDNRLKLKFISILDDGVAKRMYVPTKSTFRSSQNSLKTCEDLVTELMKKDEAWPFLKPVTVKEASVYMLLLNDNSKNSKKLNS